jgi:hypothetical protein
MIIQTPQTASIQPKRAIAAQAAAGFSALTLVSLALLHVLSPEFQPSWRMVSEYANGRFGWLLSAMFVAWALSSWLLAYALFPFATTWASKLGVGLLVIAGVGEAMAAAFDINHSLHTHAAIIGMSGLPLAALLIGIPLAKAGHWGSSRRLMVWLSNLPWLSVVLMAFAMALFFASLSRAGIVITANSKPLAELPAGVMAYGGWANRLLILAYCAWSIGAAMCRRSPASANSI